jgi:hypothetical protein
MVVALTRGYEGGGNGVIAVVILAPVIQSREDGEGSQNATAGACGCGRRILRSFAVFAALDDGGFGGAG